MTFKYPIVGQLAYAFAVGGTDHNANKQIMATVEMQCDAVMQMTGDIANSTDQALKEKYLPKPAASATTQTPSPAPSDTVPPPTTVDRVKPLVVADMPEYKAALEVLDAQEKLAATADVGSPTTEVAAASSAVSTEHILTEQAAIMRAPVISNTEAELEIKRAALRLQLAELK